MLDRPICIVGAARSGTTVLGQLLSRHPDIAYWEEPKYLWQYRNPLAQSDIRVVDEATPAVRHYIRTRLASRVKENGATRLLEKTPSNCFRIPFVYTILPDVRIIHLVRDGRDVAFSARQLWQQLNGKRTENGTVDEDGDMTRFERIVRPIWDRIRTLEVPLVDLPFYAAKYMRMLVEKCVRRVDQVYIWGPKFPGIRKVVRSNDLLEICAIQWAKSVRAARKGLHSVPDDQQLEVRFEELVQRPPEVLHRILSFAELRRFPPLIEHAKETLRKEAAHRWHHREDKDIRRIMDEVGELIRELDSDGGSSESKVAG